MCTFTTDIVKGKFKKSLTTQKIKNCDSQHRLLCALSFCNLKEEKKQTKAK